MVKDRRVNNPSDVKRLMQEQINQLRKNDELDPIKKANAIGYLSNISLSAYKEGEAMKKLEELQDMIENLNQY